MHIRRFLTPRRALAAFAGVAVASTLGITVGTASADQPSTPQSDPAAQASWSDEFDGDAGSAPDASKWTHEVNGDGGGNGELQYYTDGTENSELDGNGNLVITAKHENPNGYQCHYGPCEYTSARLVTAQSFTQQYGHFEARIKVPSGTGMWPSARAR